MMSILYGLLAGIISGFGMGGGTILILFLTTFLGMEQHVAQATNLIFFLPASIAAIWTNRKEIKIDKRLVVTIVFWGILGSFIGANLSLHLEVGILRKLFGIFLLLIAINEIYSIWKMHKNNQKHP